MSVCVDVCQVELLKLRKANAALEEQNNSLMDRYARAERQIKEAADQAKGTHGERQAFETELAMAKAKAAELDAQLRELTCDGTVDKETLLRALRIVKRNPADDSAISASVVGKDVSQLRAENAELAHECEKLRQLLLVQESINSEQEKVAQGASQGIELVRSDLDKQINELHGKVQSRDARIAALQQQLKSSQMHHVSVQHGTARHGTARHSMLRSHGQAPLSTHAHVAMPAYTHVHMCMRMCTRTHAPAHPPRRWGWMPRCLSPRCPGALALALATAMGMDAQVP